MFAVCAWTQSAVIITLDLLQGLGVDIQGGGNAACGGLRRKQI